MSNEDDAETDAQLVSDGLAREISALNKNVAIGTGIIALLLVVVITAIVLSRGF